ncbi:transposase [Hydrogenibacillus schlegelii]|uniref:Transposase n=1 Tax=Hydrogenibacillus schlegelii TaxID=1484 RepID=A0A179IS42_HYDSH|nr:transposase [Hydrogenibacillus schlegelii]OAR04642.1 transposase [Hydrogenibacillus schlegelii]
MSVKNSFTIIGEFFPEVYPAFRSGKWARGEEDPLTTEMRLFSACLRWSYRRILKGVSRTEIKKQGQDLFGLNSRYVDDARLKAQGMIDAQKELLELEIETTEAKLRRARKKLGWAMEKRSRAEKNGLSKDELRTLDRTVPGRQARVSALEKRLKELREHKENGTVPTAIFGGRKLWRNVCKGKATRDEWRAARKNRLYARGDRTKGGNPNLKITFDGHAFRMAVTISHLSEPTGVDALGRPIMRRAPRVLGRLWIPPKHRARLLGWLAEKRPYTAELIRGPDGRFRVHIALELDDQPAPDFSRGALAVDINPDGVGLANVSSCGLPEPWPKGFRIPHPKNLGKYDGEFQVIPYPSGFLTIRVPELAYASGFRRRYLIGVLAKVVVDVAKALGKPLAMETLSFDQGRLDRGKTFNRMAAQFPYAMVLQALMRRAVKENVGYKQVPPQHTSTIGRLKYEKKYGVPVHGAAALVIGRRAMGFRERITREVRDFVLRVKERRKPTGDLRPREGTGMTRKVEAALQALETKLLLHNGLARRQQESFFSCWRELKTLALAFR